MCHAVGFSREPYGEEVHFLRRKHVQTRSNPNRWIAFVRQCLLERPVFKDAYVIMHDATTRMNWNKIIKITHHI